MLNFTNDFLSSKMATDSNRRLVEGVLRTVLGKPCRVRSAVGESAPSCASMDTEGYSAVGIDLAAQDSATANVEAATDYDSGLQAEPDSLEDVTNDPVVHDLVSRGGQVTGVQMLTEDE